MKFQKEPTQASLDFNCWKVSGLSRVNGIFARGCMQVNRDDR